MKESEAQYKEMYKNVSQKRKELIERYTRIAEERTRNCGFEKNYEEKNMNTIGMITYMCAVNNLKEYDFMPYLGETSEQENQPFGYYLIYDYHPFDFQMIFISKQAKFLYEKKVASVKLSAPNGLNSFLVSNSFQITEEVKSYGISLLTGYLLVLPLAPFKWTVEIQIDGKALTMKKNDICMVYFTNNIAKLSDYLYQQRNYWSWQIETIHDSNMYFLLNLLKCMVFVRDQFNLKYNVPINQDQLCDYDYKMSNYPSKYEPSNVYVKNYCNNKSLCLFESIYSQLYNCRVICNEIHSGQDILSFDRVSFDKIKTSWTVNDYLSIGNDIGSISSIDNTASFDVSEFKIAYNEMNSFKAIISSLSSEE